MLKFFNYDYKKEAKAILDKYKNSMFKNQKEMVYLVNNKLKKSEINKKYFLENLSKNTTIRNNKIIKNDVNKIVENKNKYSEMKKIYKKYYAYRHDIKKYFINLLTNYYINNKILKQSYFKFIITIKVIIFLLYIKTNYNRKVLEIKYVNYNMIIMRNIINKFRRKMNLIASSINNRILLSCK